MLTWSVWHGLVWRGGAWRGVRQATLLLYLNDEESDGMEGGQTSFPLSEMPKQDLAGEIKAYLAAGVSSDGAEKRGQLGGDCEEGLSVRPTKGSALLFCELAPASGTLAAFLLHVWWGHCRLASITYWCC